MITNNPRIANFPLKEQNSLDTKIIENRNENIISPLPNKMYGRFDREISVSPKNESEKYQR